MRVREAGLELHGTLERSFGLLVPARSELVKAQVQVRVCVVRVDGEGAIQALHGLLRPLEREQRRAEIVPGAHVVGLRLDGRAEGGRGGLRTAERLQHDAEVVVGLREHRGEAHGALELLHRAFEVSLVLPDVPREQVQLRVVGVQLEGARDGPPGPREVASLLRREREVLPAEGIVGSRGRVLVEARQRLGEAPGALQREAFLEKGCGGAHGSIRMPDWASPVRRARSRARVCAAPSASGEDGTRESMASRIAVRQASSVARRAARST